MGVARNLRRVRGATGEPHCYLRESRFAADPANRHNQLDFLDTMVEDASVDHVPVLTGGSGKAELREFYATHFIPRMPPDMEMVPIFRTIAEIAAWDPE
jgi:hypothetical protein